MMMISMIMNMVKMILTTPIGFITIIIIVIIFRVKKRTCGAGVRNDKLPHGNTWVNSPV